ncbi:MAG: universal stress protein [Chromatiaceae bacterium]|nr:universal stress protein [Gammaproteobacteria bacterium]MCP5427830.1 universal stress protein [Chromatiaceae bacterium]MCB1861739.1 universal stress protein [Gammaproteobacteria bacterium]MCB1873858.1 universal stress protein [Gammaproteobacteria bacterium]MCB1879881.1 universal stress protein [Gammaproteobacteria bacterium]
MALRDILVHIDHTAPCEKRVRIAVELAASQGAELTGLYSKANAFMEYRTSGLEKRREKHAKDSEKLRERFAPMAEKADVKLNWITAPFDRKEDFVTDQVIFYTQHFDLVVVGQYDVDIHDGSVPLDLAERLVMESGRPVLVIPYAGKFDSLGKRVVVAWNTARESVRALNDAMPIMRDAKKVKVVAINPRQKGKRHGQIPSADIVQHLIRHGVNAVGDYFDTKGVDEGNLLLNTAAEERADLLVMGAYGTHRFRELILGGATSTVLKQMTTPVLMSH